MPSVGLKCKECGADTKYQEVRYVWGRMVVNHKPDCSQNDALFQAMYLTALGYETPPNSQGGL